MANGSEAVLYDTDGSPLAIDHGVATPADTPLLMIGGSDGTNSRYITIDSSGRQIVVGTGTAGSPSGGVITIQGDPSGTPAPISGTVTANAGSGNFSVVQATAANLNATVIGTITANIGTTGGLALDSTLAKLTIPPGTAIGSNTLAMVGGHVTTVSPTYTNGNINQLSLTTAGALRVDGSSVTQPVSGTITANQGGAPWSQNITQFGGVAVSTGTGASGTGIPRVTVANDSNILATQSGTWTVQQGTPPWSVVGPGATGAALSGNPVRVAGSDGTNTRNIITDTSGRLLVSGAAADGATVTGNPVLIGGTDGTNAQTVELRNTHPVGDVQGVIVRNIQATNPTFYAVFDRITLSANKYLATLFNTSSTRKVVVQRIWVYNWQFDTVVGGNGDSTLWKITARTAGTTVTPRAEDSNDTLSVGISADTDSTAVTQNHLIMRVIHSGDESNLANANWINASTFSSNALRYERKIGNRGITLRQNQGISLQWITGDADGTWSIIYEFTDEVV